MKRDKIACNCENVTYGQIIDAVNGGSKTFEEVSEITGCSTGCGGCREFIEVFVRDLVMFPEDQEQAQNRRDYVRSRNKGTGF